MLLPLLLTVTFAFAPRPIQDPGTGHEGHDHGEPVVVEQEEEKEFFLRPLESPAGPHSLLPSLVKGADRETYLSWVDVEAEGMAVLRLARLGSSSWSAPMEVVRGKDLMLNWADFPSVQVSSTGVVIVSWLRKGANPHGYSAEFRISTDHCRTFGPVTRLHSDDSPVEHGFVSIAPMGKDRFGAIWLDGRGASAHGSEADHGAMSLYFRTISVEEKLGPEILLDGRVCSCCPTHLIATPDGGLLASYRDRSKDEVRDIATLRFDGKVWSKPSIIHADGWMIPGCPVNGPRLAMNSSLRGVAWFTAAGKSGAKAYAKVGGRGFEELPAVSIADKATLGRVDMVPVLLDNVLVTWLEDLGEGQAEWRLRRLTKAGFKADSFPIARVSAGRSSGFLRMIPAGKGAVLAWTAGGDKPRVQTVALRPTNP